MQWQKNLPLLCIFDASHNVYSICFALDFATLQDFFTHVETGGQSGGPLLNQLTIRKQKKKKNPGSPHLRGPSETQIDRRVGYCVWPVSVDSLCVL